MSTETTSKGQIGDLERLVPSLSANAAEIPHLEVSRNQLGALLTQAREAADLQALHTAASRRRAGISASRSPKACGWRTSSAWR